MEEVFRGTTIGNYKLISFIGRGGMGEVYKAQHIHLENLAAIKILIKGEETDIRTVQSFLREAQAAAMIKHENVVQVYDIGETPSYWYIIMEFVSGADCAQLLRRFEKIPVFDCVRLAKDAARGLQAIHAHHLIHRDIKPHNLFITHKMITKVGDFGLVRYQDTVENMSTKLAGTPAYMSPEQLISVKEVNATSDVYSLGATLYHLVTGKQIYAGKTFHEILMALGIGSPFPSPREILPEIPKSLDEIILKMLQREQASRYQSMDEVLIALTEFEESHQEEKNDEISVLTDANIQELKKSRDHFITEIKESQSHPARDSSTPHRELNDTPSMTTPRTQPIATPPYGFVSAQIVSSTEQTAYAPHANALPGPGQLDPSSPFVHLPSSIQVYPYAMGQGMYAATTAHPIERPDSLTRERYIVGNSRRISSSAKWYFGGISILLAIFFLGFFLIGKTPYQVVLAKTVDKEGRLQTDFAFHEPVFLSLLVKWGSQEISHVILKVEGEDVQKHEQVIQRDYAKDIQEEKIPISLVHKKEGKYNLSVSVHAQELSVHKKISFTLVPSEVKLDLLSANFVNHLGEIKNAFEREEVVHLYLKWKIAQSGAIYSAVMATLSGSVPEQKVILGEPVDGVHAKTVMVRDTARSPGEYALTLTLSLGKKSVSRQLSYHVLARKLALKIGTVYAANEAGNKKELFGFDEKVYIHFTAEVLEKLPQVEAGISGNDIEAASTVIPFPGNKVDTRMAVKFSEFKEQTYTVTFSLKAREDAVISSLSFRLEKPLPAFEIVSLELLNDKKQATNLFLFQETPTLKIEWKVAHLYGQETGIIKVAGSGIVPQERKFEISAPRTGEQVIPLRLLSKKPGSYQVEVHFEVGQSIQKKSLSFWIKDRAIAVIVVSPDSVKTAPEETVRFEAKGYDRDKKTIPFKPVWSATGGEITQEGFFRAPLQAGLHKVKATDRETGISGEATVMVPYPLGHIELEPSFAQEMKPGDRLFWTAAGYDTRGEKIDFDPHWEVTGGTFAYESKYKISYTAGNKGGSYYVQVSDVKMGLPKRTLVTVKNTGWFGEILPSAMVRGAGKGEYLWTKDRSVMVYVPADMTYQQGFYIDKHELSIAQFAAFVKETGYRTVAESEGYTIEWDGRRFERSGSTWRSLSQIVSSRCPLVYVSVMDMNHYARWAGKRLPTQIEWMKAAGKGFSLPDWRGSVPVKLVANPNMARIYPWGDEEPGKKRCNYAPKWETRGEDGYEFLSPVGSYPEGASPYGCLDMVGNAAEWTAQGTIHGGSWCHPAGSCTVLSVNTFPSRALSNGNNCVGGRMVVDGK